MSLNKEKVLKDLGLCARCRQCRMVCEIPIATTMLPICPAGEYFKFDTYYASGRVTLAKKMLLGKIEYDESILKAVYSCTLCGSCKQQCPILRFDPMEATMVMREIAVERGIADKIYPMPSDKPVEASITECNESDIALFIGSEAQSDAKTVQAIAAALHKAGICFKAFSGTECGEYLLRKGDCAEFEKKMAAVKSAVMESGIKTLIAHDPMTYKVLKQDYNFDAEGIKVLFYLELLLGKVKGNAGKKAAYHDPSYLGRYMGMYDLPREIISALGYDLAEMLRSRENAFSSGGFPDGMEEVAELASTTILKDVEEAGVEVLITVGRNTAAQLKKTALKIGSHLTVKDLAELL